MQNSKAHKIRANVEAWTTTIFMVLSRLFITFLVIALFVMVYKGLSNDKYIVQAFQVPGEFEEKGYNGVVLSRKVQDRLVSIKEYISSAKQDSVEFEANLEPDLEIGLMGFGLSLNTVTYHLKSLLGRENKIITGELTDLSNKMELTFRMSGFETKTFSYEYEEDPNQALDYLLEETAKTILKNTDPYRLAVYHYRKKEYPKALNIILDLLKKEEDKEWAYLAWGNVLNRQDKKEEAKEKFKKALEIEPQFEIPTRLLAWEYFEERDYSRAIEYFDLLLEIDPKNFSGIRGLAQCYQYSDRHEEAGVIYDRLIETHPDEIWSYINKAGFMLHSLKDTVGAMSLYQTASEMGTDGLEKYYAMGNFYSAINDYEKCHLYLDKILELQPKNGTVWNWKANLFYNQGKYEKVLTYLDDVRGISKESDGNKLYNKQSALNWMAMASYQLKNYQQALELAKESIAVFPESSAPYTTLAETYSYMGKDELFYEAIETAFEKGFQPKFVIEDDAYQRFVNKQRFKNLVKKYEQKQEPLDQVAKN